VHADQPDESGNMTRNGEWVWQAAATGAVTQARDRTRCFLAEGPTPPEPAALEDALLVVSELVSNAVRHAPGPCTLDLSEGDELLTIAVSDSSGTPPQPRAGDLENGGGFGWQLVRSLTQRIWVQLWPDDGKTVTATMRCPAVAMN
jgi:two-component sensor histidine kinase